MDEFLGGILAGAPLWIVIGVVVIVAIGGLIYYLTPDMFGSRKTEWQKGWDKKRKDSKNGKK